MKKRIISICTAVTILGAMTTIPVLATDSGLNGSLDNIKAYQNAIYFTDISADAWFYKEVTEGTTLGIINGKDNNKFDPDGNLTYAEAIALASKVHIAYYDNEAELAEMPSPEGEHWVTPYYYYAQKYGIVDSTLTVNKLDTNCSRGDMASMFSKAIDENDLSQINDDSLAPESLSTQSEAVIKLYRAGVMIGDNIGFRAGDSIKRSEAACIILRVGKQDYRIKASEKNVIIEEPEIEIEEPEIIEPEVTEKPTTQTPSTTVTTADIPYYGLSDDDRIEALKHIDKQLKNWEITKAEHKAEEDKLWAGYYITQAVNEGKMTVDEYWSGLDSAEAVKAYLAGNLKKPTTTMATSDWKALIAPEILSSPKTVYVKPAKYSAGYREEISSTPKDGYNQINTRYDGETYFCNNQAEYDAVMDAVDKAYDAVMAEFNGPDELTKDLVVGSVTRDVILNEYGSHDVVVGNVIVSMPNLTNQEIGRIVTIQELHSKMEIWISENIGYAKELDLPLTEIDRSAYSAIYTVLSYKGGCVARAAVDMAIYDRLGYRGHIIGSSQLNHAVGGFEVNGTIYGPFSTGLMYGCYSFEYAKAHIYTDLGVRK